MAWERDSLNRLYYGLWIMFLGGLVLSLHVVISQHSYFAYALLAAFRLLAITGTAVNFEMQYHAINSLSKARLSLYCQAFDALGTKREMAKANDSDRIVAACEIPLQLIAAAFLLLAFVGSFLVKLS